VTVEFNPKRILVTGSRDWRDRHIVYRALDQAVTDLDGWVTPDQYGNTLPDPRKVVVVHGGCPTGADRFADDWCVGAIIEPVVFRADWATHGRSAGPVRNRSMVKAGASLVLAFVGPCTRRGCPVKGPHGSHGASGLVELAVRAGVPVRGYGPRVPTGQ
jgi:hypothetical protein